MKNLSPYPLRRRSAAALLLPAPQSNAAHRVLGLDPSIASTGYAYWLNGRLVTGRIETDKLRGPYRLVYVQMQLQKVLEKAAPTLVAMEDYAMGARGNNMFHIGELGGVLKTLIWSMGIDALPIPPTVMKSVIALSGKADKFQISEALKNRFQITVEQHDEADAAGLLLVGEMKCGVRRIDAKVGKSDRFDSVRKAKVVKGKLQLISK